MLPKEEAAHWIEHILAFGADHLQSHAINLPWYQLFILDVLAVLVISVYLL